MALACKIDQSHIPVGHFGVSSTNHESINLLAKSKPLAAADPVALPRLVRISRCPVRSLRQAL